MLDTFPLEQVSTKDNEWLLSWGARDRVSLSVAMGCQGETCHHPVYFVPPISRYVKLRICLFAF